MRYTRSAAAIAAAMALLLAACGEDANDEFGDTTAPTAAAVEDTAVSPDDVGNDESSSPQTTEPSETTVAPPSTEAASESDEQSPTWPGPVTGTRAEVDPIAVVGPADVIEGQHWLLPWRDGFVSVRIEIGPQASPELPEELAELIPQEVWDLFPDGLPPTLAEAQQIISDAELLDVVLDVLAENEELGDAIYSGEIPTEVTADFTVDGVAWESIPVELPMEARWVQQVVSTGGEIALFGVRTAEDDTPLIASSIATPPEYYVASSNGSFEDWSVEILAASLGDDVDGIINVAGTDVAFAANDDRWIVRSVPLMGVDIGEVLRLAGIEPTGGDGYLGLDGYVLRYTPEALIVHPPIFIAWEDLGVSPWEEPQLEPDEVLELAGIDLGTTEEFAGFSWSSSEEGMTILLDPEDIGNVGREPVTVPWEDTDLTTEQVSALRDALDALGPGPWWTVVYQGAVESWSAEWDGEPTYMASDEEEPWSEVSAVESGFLRHAEERLEFSTDGVSWAPVEGALPDHDVVGTMVYDDGIVVLMMGSAGTRTFLVSSDMQQWQEVLVDGLPREFWSTQGGFPWTPTSRLTTAEVVSAPDPPDAVWLLATTDGATWIFDPLGSADDPEEIYDFRAARNESTVLAFGPEGWARYEIGG